MGSRGAVRGLRPLIAAIAASLTLGTVPASAPASAVAGLPASVAVLGSATQATGAAKRLVGVAAAPSTVEPYWACPVEQCEAIVDPRPARTRAGRFQLPGEGPLLQGSGENGGYDPQDLRSAYDIPAGGGSEQTIALVDAYGFPQAEADLATYRERYGLPPCTAADGCFEKVNQAGVEGEYPAPAESWETESALDVEMASAACPECHIMLVEATSNSSTNLADAVDTAVRLGATEVSASYGSPASQCEAPGACAAEISAYDHPGVLIAAAGGDEGFGPRIPASFPGVVAVGGTALHRTPTVRGWSEEVWSELARGAGTGGGCTTFAKPAWQLDTGCDGRTANDVSADASCSTPVSVFNVKGWANVCGDSASTPLVVGIEAHAGAYARAQGAAAFYEDPAAVNDVTEGSDGECSALAAYLCNAEPGYDAPTGVGTPAGPLQLSAGAAPLAQTRPAREVSGGSATLVGTVGPQGAATSYQFEYGPTSAYGTSVPVPAAALAPGPDYRTVAQTVAGLQAGTTYHYRLVVSSSEGTGYGQDGTFVTAPPSVSAVTPASGPIDGAGAVSISGADFAGATEVRFGSLPARSFTVASESSIVATPPLGHGEVDVTVTTPAGTSAASPADEYSYEPQRDTVLAWGGGGMLGDGVLSESLLPVEVLGAQASALAAGADFGLALSPAGGVSAWGADESGQLGDGGFAPAATPVPVCAEGVGECPEGPYLGEVTAVAAGAEHSLALLSDGAVLAWGSGAFGQLGADTAQSADPVPVCTVLESPCLAQNQLRGVLAVAAGRDFSLALLADGAVVAWGANASGQLGNGSDSGPETCEGSPCSRVPVAVEGLADATALAAGAEHALALTGAGEVMAWGAGKQGQLGDGALAASSVPVPVCAAGEEHAPCHGSLGGVKALAAGELFSLALLGDGRVLSWGGDQGGALGVPGAEVDRDAPVEIEALGEVGAIASGPLAGSALALLEDGRLVSWGANAFGALGDGTRAAAEGPVYVCAAYATAACPEGPDLLSSGQVGALAVGGRFGLAAIVPSAGPAVTGVRPRSGSLQGGTTVTISGEDLAGASAVRFGGVEASELRVLSSHELTAVAPAGTGTVEVSVSGPEGARAPGPESAFTYRGAPVVVTGAGASSAPTLASLQGTVDPEEAAVGECRFEYGTTAALGSSSPCLNGVGAGVEPVAAEARLSGLSPETTYYFRLAAANARGRSVGETASFTTDAPLEVGRCLKRHAGAFAKAGCTKSSGGRTGGEEWLAGPPPDPRFSIAGGTASFEGAKPPGSAGKPPVVSCKTSTGTGELDGPATLRASIAFAGCQLLGAPGGTSACHSAGLAAGAVALEALEGRFGWQQREKLEVALDLFPAGGGETVARLECATQTLSWRGSVLVPVKANKMGASLSLKYAGKQGKQVPEALEGAPRDVLEQSLLGESFTVVGLSTTLTLNPAEPFEVRAFS